MGAAKVQVIAPGRARTKRIATGSTAVARNLPIREGRGSTPGTPGDVAAARLRRRPMRGLRRIERFAHEAR